MKTEELKSSDIEVYNAIQNELERQRTELNMIPSESYASRAVLEAMGSVLNNKYAEGYPKKRYYQGNKYCDEIETIAIERAKKLFNAEHANVQPNSGSPANMAIYFSVLNPGDKIMGMDLSHGGHLTHGSPVNFSGKLFSFAHYGVDKETEMLDMDKVREIALKEKPKMIVSGYTAYPRTVDFRRFHEIAQEIGAYSMADISHIAGLIVGDVHPSPLPFTDFVMTTTHKTLRGPRSAIILCKEKYAAQLDKAVFPGLQGGPHEHTIAGKAVCFKEAMEPEFKQYAMQIVKNAKALAETLMAKGIKLVSNGTDNHLILIDLIKTKSAGKQGMGKEIAVALEEAGIVLNANTIPFDPSTPFKPSGLRLGTPILTQRGMNEDEMKQIGEWIADIIEHPNDAALKQKVRQNVLDLCRKFPIY
ncbi:MAG: serine hydroxymethyltransferase [Candidatus Woesearchaeota archaeon]|nr:serine hydroxymethyltransferase [Candidatus Woesearchaeota archaeon]